MMCAREAENIGKNKPLSAAFLIEIGRIRGAEAYLLDRIGQLNGDFHGSLLPLAEAMEAHGRPLSATILYRALLDSISRRPKPKPTSTEYATQKKLDRLAMSVSDWRDIETHPAHPRC